MAISAERIDVEIGRIGGKAATSYELGCSTASAQQTAVGGEMEAICIYHITAGGKYDRHEPAIAASSRKRTGVQVQGAAGGICQRPSFKSERATITGGGLRGNGKSIYAAARADAMDCERGS